jgi:uracil-DNA glycosylase
LLRRRRSGAGRRREGFPFVGKAGQLLDRMIALWAISATMFISAIS